MTHTYDSYLIHLVNGTLRKQAETQGFVDARKYEEPRKHAYAAQDAQEMYEVGFQIGKLYLVKEQVKV